VWIFFSKGVICDVFLCRKNRIVNHYLKNHHLFQSVAKRVEMHQISKYIVQALRCSFIFKVPLSEIVERESEKETERDDYRIWFLMLRTQD
jgi:hypothetical protein